MKSAIVIPARLESTRLPRKLLLAETGKPLILHTYEAARKAKLPQDVVVATDSESIGYAVAEAGGRFFLTDPNLASGTDRVAVVAEQMPEIEIIVNVQGDEPEVDPVAIDQLIELLQQNPEAKMATVGTPIRDAEIMTDPARVKVVVGQKQQALYFSRAPIPHDRDGELTSDNPDDERRSSFLLHLGMYAYRRDFLQTLSQLPQTPLEQLEKLEQLRVLEHGYSILVGVVDEPTRGIDTRADYEAFVSRMRS